MREEMLIIHRTRSDEEDTRLERLRERMSNAIDRFYDEWTTVLPGPALEAKLETDASSWERLLLFPSDFASGDRTELGLERLTWIERELRVGLAIDAI